MSQLGKVVFIDSVHPILWDRLVEMGFQCIDCTKLDYQLSEEELLNAVGWVIRSKFKITSEILSQTHQLKFIARAGSGLENIDLAASNAKGIKVFSSPEGNRDAVAEHVVGSLLALRNHLKRVDHQVRENVWLRAENRGDEIKGKTIALIGYGVMGQAVAERLSGFGAHLIANDNQKQGFSDQWVQEVSLQEVFEQADIVSLHMNYLAENKYYVNRDFINSFHKNFVLINTARGMHVNTADLIEALKSGKVSGACLDVLEFEAVSFEMAETEHPDFAFLKKAENVLLSPHIAGWTHESYYKLSAVLADKIETWISGMVE